MPDGLVRVQPIYVQDVDGFRSELRYSLIEAGPQQVREVCVKRLVVAVNLFEYAFAEDAGVGFTQPVIYCVAARRKAVLTDGLAKSEIRIAIMRAKLNEERGPAFQDKIMSKRKMTRPRIEAMRAVSPGYEGGFRNLKTGLGVVLWYALHFDEISIDRP
jgi:hypothetical protein